MIFHKLNHQKQLYQAKSINEKKEFILFLEKLILISIKKNEKNFFSISSPFKLNLLTIQPNLKEVSSQMVGRLKKRGYKVIETGDISDIKENDFDAITLLNVLDRCDKPLTLLRQIHSKLKKDGILLIAVVLPFSSFVENGSEQNTPSEYLDDMLGEHPTIECQMKHFIENIFIPCGFECLSFSRLPYLCAGDLNQFYYLLNDAIFVLRPVAIEQTDSQIVFLENNPSNSNTSDTIIDIQEGKNDIDEN